MKHATRSSPRVTLDWSRLFGFDQVTRPTKIARERPLAIGGLVKIGAKVGEIKRPPT